MSKFDPRRKLSSVRQSMFGSSAQPQAMPRQPMAEQGSPFSQDMWDEKTSAVQWGEKGHSRYNSNGSSLHVVNGGDEGQLSPQPPMPTAQGMQLPPSLMVGAGMERSDSPTSFLNGRQKLGGKEIPDKY